MNTNSVGFFSKYTNLNKAECTFSAWFIQYILLMLEPTRNKIEEKSIFFIPMKDSYAGQMILFLAANVRISSSRSKTNQNQVKDQDKEASIDVSLVLISEILYLKVFMIVLQLTMVKTCIFRRLWGTRPPGR